MNELEYALSRVQDLELVLSHLLIQKSKLESAIHNPGPNPKYHLFQVQRLKNQWPTLAQALDDFIGPYVHV